VQIVSPHAFQPIDKQSLVHRLMGLLNKPYVREDEMFQVTENASAIIKDFLKDKEEAPSIRIMLNHGG